MHYQQVPVCTLPFSQALKLGLANSGAGADHKDRQAQEIHKLIEYFTPKLGGDVDFTQIRKRDIKGYVDSLMARDLSPSYIRAAINPLRLASRYMDTEYETGTLAIVGLPKRREPVKTWCTIAQVVKLWETAKDSGWEDAAVLVVLMGLGGLRLTEANRLVPGELKSDGTLWVGVTRAKNDPSCRVIPLPRFVAEQLTEYWESGRELSPRRDTVGAQLRRLFRAYADDCADPAEAELFRKMAPKDLRKTVPNELSGETMEHFINAYIGHSPKRMLGRHYQATTPKPNMAELVRKRAIADLQEQIVDRIEEKLRALKQNRCN